MEPREAYVRWYAGQKTYEGQPVSLIRTLALAKAANKMHVATKRATAAHIDFRSPSVDDNFELSDYGPDFACGCLLLEAKTRFGHIQSWTAWLKDVAAIPPKSAQARMKRTRELLGITLPAGCSVYRRRKVPKSVANAVFKRDGWSCYLCGKSTSPDSAGGRAPDSPSLDHVVPESAGGDPTEDNLRCACWECNSKKGASTETITAMILHSALMNCFSYLKHKEISVGELNDSQRVPMQEMQRLWRTFVMTDWEDEYYREKAAIYDSSIIALLDEAEIPGFPLSNWLEETARFVRERWDSIPRPKWLTEGMVLEIKITDEHDAIRVERKKLVPRPDGFGGNQIIVETERIPYPSPEEKQ